MGQHTGNIRPKREKKDHSGYVTNVLPTGIKSRKIIQGVLLPVNSFVLVKQGGKPHKQWQITLTELFWICCF